MPSFLAARRIRVARSRVMLVALLSALAACSDTIGPSPVEVDDPPPPITTDPGIATLAAASASAARVEVELVRSGGTWMAREVEVQTAADLSSLERIESRVTTIDATAGRVILELGGLGLNLPSEARFVLDADREVSRDEFVSALVDLMATGATPGIEFVRSAVLPAQAPGEVTFAAELVRLNADGEDQVLDLNMDSRHFRTPAGGGGQLTFLGLELAIDPASSSVVQRSGGQAGAQDIDGMAAAADEGAGSVTLEDGTVLRILPGTRIKDGGDRLGSVAAVAAALGEGTPVEVDADAVLESEGVFVAIKVSFDPEASDSGDGSDGDDSDEEDEEEEEEEEEDGEEEDDEEEGVQFGGNVVSVDLEAGTFLMTTGKVLTVGEGTAFDEEGDLLTLEAMAGALAAGDQVMAEGRAEADADTGAWLVLQVRVEASGEDGSFGGRVASVDQEAGTFTLKSSKVLTISEETAFDEDGDLTSLEAMEGAIAAGDVVTVEGEAEKDPETGEWKVLSVRVNASGDDGEFGGRVDSVDLEAGTFTLKSGKVMTVGEGTTFSEDGDLASLDAMAGALAAGDVVTVEGMAEKDSETGAWVATELTVMTNGEDGEFGGKVDAITTEDGTFTLKNGRVLTVTSETTFDADGAAVTLEEMATLFDGGAKLNVTGMMAQDPDTGAWLVTEISVKKTGKP